MMKKFLYPLILFPFFLNSCNKENGTKNLENSDGNKNTEVLNKEKVPAKFVGRKLYNLLDGRDYLIINKDGSFSLHEFIPNSDESFNWKGSVDGMELNPDNQLTYRGRNDYKPTEINRKMEIRESNVGPALCLKFESFNTITGNYSTEVRNYTQENVSPF